MIILLIAIGGALGSISRYGAGRLLQPHGAGTFPIATMIINIAGSFILGFVYQRFDQAMVPRIRSLAGAGFCGGFTTFSTFSFDAVSLFQEGDYSKACIYITASVVCCLVGTVCGMMLGKALLPR